MPECEFVAAVARAPVAACSWTSTTSTSTRAIMASIRAAYLAAIPPAAVAEIHLAGFDASGPIVIDTHGAPVAPEVWRSTSRRVARFGRVPTLIEWDTDIPGARRAGARSSDGASRARGARCHRCVNCRGASPARCTPVRTSPDPGIAVYRNTVAANYRNALAATYRVVRGLLGDSLFDAAVDAFVTVHPSTRRRPQRLRRRASPTFLANSENVRELPFLPDVARLEWAIDCAHRAADAQGSAEDDARGAGGDSRVGHRGAAVRCSIRRAGCCAPISRYCGSGARTSRITPAKHVPRRAPVRTS